MAEKDTRRGYLVTFVEDALVNRQRRIGEPLLHEGIREALVELRSKGFGLIGVSRLYSLPSVPLERARIDDLFDWIPSVVDLNMTSAQSKLVRSACFNYGLGVKKVAVGIGNLTQRRDAAVNSRGIINFTDIEISDLTTIMERLFPKT